MKYRDYKNFAPNSYFHVFNRGNGKRDIFLDSEDLKFFLVRMRENLFPGSIPVLTDIILQTKSHTPYIRKILPPGSFDLLCYCLMPNHFHLIMRQNSTVPISKFVSKVCTSYSKYFNSKYESTGGVFEDQFKAVLVESDSQLMWLSAYVHQNPKVAGIVPDLKKYPWSSYLDYIGDRNGTLCNQNFVFSLFSSNRQSYQNFVEDAFNKIRERKDIEKLLLDF